MIEIQFVIRIGKKMIEDIIVYSDRLEHTARMFSA